MLPPNRCAFHSVAELFGWPACEGGLQRHHVLNRTLLQGNRKALEIAERRYRRIFLRWACSAHNVGRYADSCKGRAFLLRQFPEEIVRRALGEIATCFKDGDFLSYERLVGSYAVW